MQQSPFHSEQHAELRVTDTRGICEHGLEHRLKVARRAGDDFEHRAGGGLLLTCLSEFARQRCDLHLQVGNGNAVYSELPRTPAASSSL